MIILGARVGHDRNVGGEISMFLPIRNVGKHQVTIKANENGVRLKYDLDECSFWTEPGVVKTYDNVERERER